MNCLRFAEDAARDYLVQAALDHGSGWPAPGKAVQRGGFVDRLGRIVALLVEAGTECLKVIGRAEVLDIADHRRRRSVVGVEPAERATATAGPIWIDSVFGARQVDMHQFPFNAEVEVNVTVTLSKASGGEQFHAEPPRRARSEPTRPRYAEGLTFAGVAELYSTSLRIF